MDVLRRAYCSDSDSDADDNVPFRRPGVPLASKRLRSDGPSHWAEPTPAPAPLLPGRYVSKREKAMATIATSTAAMSPPPPLPTVLLTRPDDGDIIDSGPPREVLESARTCGEISRCSGRVLASLNSHSSAVSSLEWSRSHVCKRRVGFSTFKCHILDVETFPVWHFCKAHLLASAGMDHTVRVWNVWNRKEKLARTFCFHNAAVKDVKWSPLGLSLLSCGYDCSSRLIDIEKGIETQVFKEDQIVMSIRHHPNNPELFLSGGMKGSLKLWDIRNGKVVKKYLKSLGPILDIEFSTDAKHFISSSDASLSNISENAIIFWDISREIPVSNQIYAEAFTCPCIRCHPFDCSFVAQSNGNYIAIFSARPPFRLDRFKRYEAHTVSGFPIKCNFSSDGKEIISGSADGFMYFYDYRTTELRRKIKAFDEACIDVALHPHLSNVVASCSWKGEISVFW